MSDITTDVVVVGSGAAGLLATATLRTAGIEAILVESTELIGGSSAMSGGALWLPNNHLMGALGESDSLEAAREYLDAIIGDESPGSSRERRDAYLQTAPELAIWLEKLGLRLEVTAGCPDYYPESPGGKTQGRSVESAVVDADVLGEWREHCRFTVPLALTRAEAPWFARSLTTFTGFATAAKVIARRAVLGRVRGKHLVSGGAALVTGLLRNVLDSGAGLWREAPLQRLLTDGEGRVTGVVVLRNGFEMPIHARRGVILCSGGFERNQQMREQYLSSPTDASWSSGNPGNLGHGLRAAIEVGCALDLTDEAWWAPSFRLDDGTAHVALWERTLPHSIIVDSAGDRYFNEACPSADAGQIMYAHEGKHVSSIPSYLIMDNRHRSRYPLTTWLPNWTPRAAVERGDIVKAKSIAELANLLGVDEAGLTASVVRFNDHAKKGKDPDFHRGESAYDRYYADPSQKPNPSLGTIEKPPFWGIRVWPGDLGTKGGIVTDAVGRALRADGTAIDGLYAAGNVTASVMGRTHPGAGGTLGPACVFAYRAALALAATPPRPDTGELTHEGPEREIL